jgi:hypothetical protein
LDRRAAVPQGIGCNRYETLPLYGVGAMATNYKQGGKPLWTPARLRRRKTPRGAE